ncbi:MAG: hypothetical protein NXI19_10370 [Alphaproteobacteria bacterium]|nr:hypothetical protein [Alphaproteobacteria bacterium]
MAVSLAQSAFPVSPPAFAAAGRGAAALRVEPTQRVIAPAVTPGSGGEARPQAAAPFGGAARAALARVEIVGPTGGGRETGAQTPFSGGRPGVLVDQGGIQLSQQVGEGDGAETAAGAVTGQSPDTETADAQSTFAPGETSATGSTLTEEEQQVVEELQARDAEVRRHEQAHAAVGGQYAGSPTYTYQQGPDGGRYAVGGEVSIDSAPIEGDPEATILKLQTVRRAALAPAEPSAQDRAVAAAATAGIARAQAELAAQNRADRQGTEAEGETSELPEAAAADGAGAATGPDGGEDDEPFSIAAAGTSDIGGRADGRFAGRPETGGISNGFAGDPAGATLTGAIFGGASGGPGGQQPRIISIAV